MDNSDNDESSTRFRFTGSINPNRKLYDAINKTDRQEDLPLETAKRFVRFALPTKLSRCNDNFGIAFEPSPSASKSRSTLSGLATFVLIFLVSGTRIPDRYGNRVPGSKNIRKRTGLYAEIIVTNSFNIITFIYFGNSL